MYSIYSIKKAKCLAPNNQIGSIFHIQCFALFYSYADISYKNTISLFMICSYIVSLIHNNQEIQESHKSTVTFNTSNSSCSFRFS